ncbi:PIN domain-containing protein [Streptomyces hydrogenans]|uniref:PIN domain-containing protein n=1 Tax=Streptomyces hydrogenans TaxID=1873719 RepID=UPI0036E78C51
MIILDANVLRGTNLRGLEADLLRTIRVAELESVGAPWIAVEEIAAQRAAEYEEKHKAASKAVRDLAISTPWNPPQPPAHYDAEHVRTHWRNRYAEIADVLETSQAAYGEAMFRETNLLAPCKPSGDNKIGARDAAIWLTAVEYAREHPDETVYFVSENHRDFGKGDSFKPPMDQDLADLGERFVLYTSLNDVLKKFATPVDAPEDKVRELLAASSAHTTVGEEAVKYVQDRLGLIKATVSSGTRRRTRPLNRAWRPTPTVTLASVSEITAHEIHDHQWCTAVVRWLVHGYLMGGRVMSCSWNTRVVVSPTAPEKGLTVLAGWAMEPVTAEEDLAKLPELPPYPARGPRDWKGIRTSFTLPPEAAASLAAIDFSGFEETLHTLLLKVWREHLDAGAELPDLTDTVDAEEESNLDEEPT